MSIRIFQGDCRQVMATLPVCSVDAIVTDPPYELGFMGKGWDSTGVANDPETWRQALRVLKPGGYLLAFSGTRTYHRMAVAIEDAGFEIRDMIAWVYGSGFPKSLDVSKALDKAAGAERESIGPNQWADRGGLVQANTYGAPSRPDATAPATEASRQWQGWGTALKPALEPITMARKPLVGTVAANFAAHGTGGLNIDGCRVGTTKDVPTSPAKDRIGQVAKGNERGRTAETTGFDAETGRWPANLIHDGSDEVVAAFPQARSAGDYCGKETEPRNSANYMPGQTRPGWGYADTGSAARFFYCAKASRRDRDEGNIHPTVKPTELMAYLCRLVTPPGGVVLDPFMGSGSTLKAAELEGFAAIGIELSADYIAIAQRRIGADAPLFASVEVA